MSRVDRRKLLFEGRRNLVHEPKQVLLEKAIRARIARKVRNQLRRRMPVTLVAPRWSGASTFLEDIAAQLEPALRCRVVTARGLSSRADMECWNFLLHAINSLSAEGADTRPVPVVVDRRGFLIAAEQALQTAAQETVPTVLLIQAAEQLPLEVLEDLGDIWSRQEGKQVALLVAASVATPALAATGSSWTELEDFSEIETAMRFWSQAGPTPAEILDQAVRFSGGIPALVDTMGEWLAREGWPSNTEGWWRALGALGEDLKAAVQVALASPDLAERIFMLRDGRPRAEEPRDVTLLLSGLVRRVRTVGAPRVQIRAQALAALAEPID